MVCEYSTFVDGTTLFCHAESTRRIATLVGRISDDQTTYNYACDVHVMKVAAKAAENYNGEQEIVGRDKDGFFPETLPLTATI